MPHEGSFRSMGVDVVVRGADDIELAAVRRLFERWDRVFSRFRPDSELNRVNGTLATVVVVSELFAKVVRTALEAAAETGGLVDPTLGAAIVAAGYDRDFAALEDDGVSPGPAHPGRWRSVRLSGRLLARPPGTRFDLNGVVKSLAVDEALSLIRGRAFVSAGGDVAVRNQAVVGLPGGGAVEVLGGGIATSGSAVRRWRRGGAMQHHLLDPRTGRPARSRWTHVTVASDTCLAADVAAKAAFLLDEDGPGWLDHRSLPGRFVGSDTVVNASWRSAIDERAA